MAYFYAGSSEYFSFHYFDSNIGVCISGIFYVGVLLDNSYYSIFVPYFHKNTKVWMGKLNRIIVILLIVLLAVVVAQYLSQTLWWIKIMVMIPIVLVYFFMLNKFQIKKIFQ